MFFPLRNNMWISVFITEREVGKRKWAFKVFSEGKQQIRGQKECIYAQDLKEKHYADEQTISLHCRVSGGDRLSLIKSVRELGLLFAPHAWTLPPHCLNREAAAGQSATHNWLRHGQDDKHHTGHNVKNKTTDLHLIFSSIITSLCVRRGTVQPGINGTASKREKIDLETAHRGETMSMIVISHSWEVLRIILSWLHKLNILCLPSTRCLICTVYEDTSYFILFTTYCEDPL